MSVAGPLVEPYIAQSHEAAEAAPRRARSGRLRQEGLSEADRNWSVCIHLSPLVLSLVGAFPVSLAAPIVLWLIRRKQSAFNDDHGREATNFALSFLLWLLVLVITIVGWVLIPVLLIVAVINCIRGAIAASNSEYFRYPMTIRFLE